jgi:putative oxidoreductase
MFTLGRLSDIAYGLMRFVFGVLFACHGAQKLFGAFGGGVMTHSALLLTAGVIEFFGGILVAVGLMTRPAAFIASGEMAVAYFWKYAPNGPWPIQNKGEPALLYCFAFLFIAAFGAGLFRLGARLKRS